MTIPWDVVIAVIGSIEAISVVVIGGIFASHSKKLELKRAEDREEDLEYRRQREIREKARQERDSAVYGVVLSTARGTEVLLHKAHGDQLNGDVQHSLESIEKSISRYNTLANDEMAKLG